MGLTIVPATRTAALRTLALAIVLSAPNIVLGSGGANHWHAGRMATWLFWNGVGDPAVISSDHGGWPIYPELNEYSYTWDYRSSSPRANIIGPGAWNTDIGVYKNFKIREDIVFRLKGDFFNAFNHPNDANPNMTTGIQDLSNQTNSGRIIQLSLRIDW